MTSNECCAGCRFADPLGDDEGNEMIECRRYPPSVSSALLERNIETAALDIALLASTVFPRTGVGNWCGEFKAKAARKKSE